MGSIHLGGNIELTGFDIFDKSGMTVLKKMVGNYARKFADRREDFDRLKLVVKQVHGSKYELHSQLVLTGNTVQSEVVDHNIYFVLDKGLKKLEAAL